MSDDLEGRADDYERRVAAAGSTGDIIGSLVKGAERSKRFVRWLAISLILDVTLSIGLGVVSVVAFHNAQAVERQNLVSCRQTNQNSAVINEFLDLLITNTKISTVLTPKEVKSRVKGYEQLVIKIPDCR